VTAALSIPSDLAARAGAALQEGRLDEAEDAYRRLLATQPEHAGLLNNLGIVLIAQRRPAAAALLFEQSLRSRPGHMNTMVALSNALTLCNRPAAAIACCEAILALDAGNADALHNRAVALRALNRHGDAIAELEALLAQDPTDVDAQWNLALSELAVGRYRSGWRHFEARWRGVRSLPALPLASIPLWSPGEGVRGRRVLVQSEQGLGDTFHFARFIPELAAQCASVVVQTQAPLVQFMRRLLPAHRVEPLSEPLGGENFDCRLPLMSLPLALDLGEESASSHRGAYLFADSARVDAWRARLPNARARVGFVWRGNPGHRNDHNRSLPLAALRPWLDATGAAGTAIIALQKGVTRAERDYLAQFQHVHVLDDSLADFDDTAAVVALLDRVISVDTAIAHLAGGMARPGTILLPFASDWRWGLGATSDFYPSLDLLRQPAIGEWDCVVATLAERHDQG
jgi:hypothetical protein